MHHYLKSYRNRVWDLMESFFDLNFIAIPRKYIQINDALAIKGKIFNPYHHIKSTRGVKFINRPLVPNMNNY